MNQDLITIIINVHNGEKFIKECIKCVLDQTYKNFELIIWNNNSSDETEKICHTFNDKRIKYYKSLIFHRLYKARNNAIKCSKGVYIAFLDVDDLWHKKKLEIQIKKMRDEKSDLSYTDFIVNNELNKKNTIIQSNQIDKNKKIIKLYAEYKIALSTVIISKRSYEYFGGFNESYEIIGDFDLFTKIIDKFNCSRIDQALTQYRIHENNTSRIKLMTMISEKKDWLIKNKNINKEYLIDFQNELQINLMKYYIENKLFIKLIETIIKNYKNKIMFKKVLKIIK